MKMTEKEILTGLKFRIANLKKELEKSDKIEGMEWLYNDIKIRIDETESFYMWITEK